MALDKTQLKQKIKNLLNSLKDEENQENAIEEFADSLSDAIDEFVKTGEIIGVDSNGGPIQGSLQ